MHALSMMYYSLYWKASLPLLSLRWQRRDKFICARALCPSARAGLNRKIPRIQDTEMETVTRR